MVEENNDTLLNMLSISIKENWGLLEETQKVVLLYLDTMDGQKWLLDPIVSNAPFFYALKTPENLMVFWCFQGVDKGCIGNEFTALD